MARQRNRPKQPNERRVESLIIEVTGWLHDQGLSRAELLHLDWTEIAPLMERVYDISHANDEKTAKEPPAEPTQPPKLAVKFDVNGQVADIYGGKGEDN